MLDDEVVDTADNDATALLGAMERAAMATTSSKEGRSILRSFIPWLYDVCVCACGCLYDFYC